MKKRSLLLGILSSCVTALIVALATARTEGQNRADVRIDNDDIGGVVTSPKGPESGVWVIAETTELPTKFVRIVVTDDRGRYVLPDLPNVNYSVWVRGYGLVDSPRVQAMPGKIVNLSATPAPTPRAAAQVYPSNYWYSLLNVPAASEFPGTGEKGNGISESVKTQAQWIDHIKTSSCTPCHQMGNQATREILPGLGTFPSPVAAWDHRLRVGFDGGGIMYGFLNNLGKRRALSLFADWTDRIAAGEVPPAPPRPQGVERNVVVTIWDWSDPRYYFHDAVASDKRNPTVNANGFIYGVQEESSDRMGILDPVKHVATDVLLPTADENVRPSNPKMGVPSPYWGTEQYWRTRVNAHSNVMDHKGRVWNTSITRPPANNPAFCKEGSDHPSAKLFPRNTANRQYSVYDPKTKAFSFVDTCFATFHLNFAHDANNTIWSGAGGTVGWVNTKLLDETGDSVKAQGWAPLVIDTNGNGRQDAWTEADQPLDPAKDRRVNLGFYGIAVSPVDGSVWGDVNTFPGAAVRVVPGPNPPMTTLAEVFEVPTGKVPGAGYRPRGMDVDANGVFWTVLSSGHFASFDRRKCKGPLNGPTATGQHCPEGWAFHAVPGPNFKGSPDSASADSNYYNWVDKYDTFGLGKNVPVATGNLSDALLFLRDGKWIVARVPYPLGFFAKQLDGRIDNPKAGWKGKGMWTTSGNRTPWHTEGGKGTRPKVYKFQIRPNPLAK